VVALWGVPEYPSSAPLSPGDTTLLMERSGYKAWQGTLAVSPGGTNQHRPSKK
jgi:hypothetical protein